MSLFTRAFATAALERALKTAAQSAILVFGADQFNALQADWETAGGFALGGFVLSLLTSVVSANLGNVDGPSLANEVAVTRRVGSH